MSRVVVPEKDYGPGEHVIDAPLSSRGRFAKVAATLTRQSWPDRPDLLTIYFERTLDGGATWIQIGRVVAPGGVVSKRGAELLETRAGFSLRDELTGEPVEQPGEVRVRIEAREALRFALTVEARDKDEILGR